MKNIVLSLFFVFIVFYSPAQDIKNSAQKVKKQVVSSEYDRNSLTIIGLKSDNQLSAQITQMIDTVAIPEKFYSNDITPHEISFNTPVSVYDKIQQNQVFKTDVLKLLNENKVGQAVVGKWFNRQANGAFNTKLLKERGIYNSDDSDLSIAASSKRGESALMDAGLGLVDRSYVLVIGFSNLMTMNEYYDQMKATPEARKTNGIKGDLIAFLYKLNFGDSVSAVFFQNLWVGETQPDANAKIAAFDATTFPLEPVKSLVMPMQSIQYNPGQPLAPKEQKTQEQLMRDFVNNAMTNVMNHLTFQVSDFKVKAQIFKTNPIAVKIGRKEGLGFDQRYFVYENRMTRSGQEYSSLRGVIKSMSVADNRAVTTGDTKPSYFYQVAGGKIDDKGMFVEQRIDAGLNLFLGYMQDGLSGATARLEYYIGRALYSKNKGAISKGLTSFKFYLEGGYNNQEFNRLDGSILSATEKIDLMRISAGFNKDYYLTHFIHVGPFVGYGIESGKGKDSKYTIDTQFIEAGARLGINLRYNIQLVGSANYYVMFSPELKDQDAKKLTAEKYDTYFPDRGGLGISYGIRFMF